MTRTFSPAAKPFQHLPNEFKISRNATSISVLLQDLEVTLRAINVGPEERNNDTFWNRDEQTETYFVDLRPTVHSWSRQARRKATKGIACNGNAQEKSKPLFEARLQIAIADTSDHEQLPRESSPSRLPREHSGRLYTVHLIWIRGQCRANIETFWAYLSRKLVERTSGMISSGIAVLS